MVDTWRFSCAHLQSRSGAPPHTGAKAVATQTKPSRTGVNGKAHLKLPEAWKEGREAFYTRLREQCAKVNDECEVGQLCRDFPKRLADLKAKKGDVLKS